MPESGRRPGQVSIAHWVPYLAVAAGGVVADQLAKWLVFRELADSFRTVPLIPSFLSLSARMNSGGVFGIFQGRSAVFGLLSILAIIIVGWVMWAWLRHPPRPAIGLALAAILAGAIGNLIDRIAFHSVRDFIDVRLGSYSWPTFNLADIFITVGALALALLVMLERPADHAETEKTGQDGG